MTAEKRRPCGFSPTLFAAHILCLIVGTQATAVLQAYRLVQYDHGGVPSGSRTARLMQYATMKKEGATLFRNIVLLPIKDATLEIVKEILDPAIGVAGLLFLLPIEHPVEYSDAEVFMEVEKYLLLHTIAIPVYFVHHTQEIDSILTEIEEGIARGRPPNRLNGGRMMNINSGMTRPLMTPKVMNFEAWLYGSEAKAGKRGVPTVIISAHYDAFNGAPGLPGNSNASGVASLLSLVRLFGALYKHASTRPKINVLFLLTGGGGLDFLGLQTWLEKIDRQIIDSIEFVISLDDLSGLGTDDALYLHYSKPPKEQLVQQWYDRFEAAAKEEGQSLLTMHKKINLALPYMSWEHEHLARRKLFGATLSGRRLTGNPVLSSSVLDTHSTIDRRAVLKAISVVGRAVASRLYQGNDTTMPSFATLSKALPGTGHAFLDAWIRSMTQTTRMAPHVTPSSPFSTAVMRFLEAHTDKRTSTIAKANSSYVFYEGIVFELGISKASGFIFDLMLVIGVMIYLMMLFVVLRIWTQGWQSFMTIFRPSEYGWKKQYGSKGQKFMMSGKK